MNTIFSLQSPHCQWVNSSVFNCTSESPSQRSGVKDGACTGHAYMTSCALVNVFYVRKESWPPSPNHRVSEVPPSSKYGVSEALCVYSAMIRRYGFSKISENHTDSGWKSQIVLVNINLKHILKNGEAFDLGFLSSVEYIQPIALQSVGKCSL